MEVVIIELDGFSVSVPNNPHVDRLDGGHLVITPRSRLTDRTQLAPQEAINLMKLTMIVGEAMSIVLNRHGIDVVRINYQDNGNWGLLEPGGPFLHIHLYGRARSAKMQKHGEALNLPNRECDYYANCNPITENEALELRDEICRIGSTEKYRNFCCFINAN